MSRLASLSMKVDVDVFGYSGYQEKTRYVDLAHDWCIEYVAKERVFRVWYRRSTNAKVTRIPIENVSSFVMEGEYEAIAVVRGPQATLPEG
jgi:hypothetical protein